MVAVDDGGKHIGKNKKLWPLNQDRVSGCLLYQAWSCTINYYCRLDILRRPATSKSPFSLQGSWDLDRVADLLWGAPILWNVLL